MLYWFPKHEKILSVRFIVFYVTMSFRELEVFRRGEVVFLLPGQEWTQVYLFHCFNKNTFNKSRTRKKCEYGIMKI